MGRVPIVHSNQLRGAVCLLVVLIVIVIDSTFAAEIRNKEPLFIGVEVTGLKGIEGYGFQVGWTNDGGGFFAPKRKEDGYQNLSFSKMVAKDGSQVVVIGKKSNARMGPNTIIQFVDSERLSIGDGDYFASFCSHPYHPDKNIVAVARFPKEGKWRGTVGSHCIARSLDVRGAWVVDPHSGTLIVIDPKLASCEQIWPQCPTN